jgi:ParB family chromosome partitioning protein
MSPSVTPVTNATHPPLSTPTRADFRELPITALFPSPLNPRKTIDDIALAELAESVREKGVIEPLVVRGGTYSDFASAERFEIVAGERRYRAALVAGLASLPCVVRTLTDAEVVEHALTENHQRRDVHPLEEAEAIQQLMDLDTAYTVAGVAAKLGVSHSWVYGRLKLLRLDAAARHAYRAGAITAEHADLLARVPAHQQAAALIACFSQMLYAAPDDDSEDADDALWQIEGALERERWDLLAACVNSPAALKRWIANHSTVDIDDTVVQETLPELSVALADAAAEESKLLQVSLDPNLTEGAAKDLGVIRRPRWVEIDLSLTKDRDPVSSKRCEAMQAAVVTHPATPGTLRVLTVCAKRSCPIHQPKPAASARPDTSRAEQDRLDREQREQELADQRAKEAAWAEARPKYLAALAALVLKTKAVTPALVRILCDPWNLRQVEDLYGVPLTTKTALATLILSIGPLGDYATRRDSRDLEAMGRAFGWTPAQWEKAEKAASKKPSMKPAARRATKKGGR